MVLWLYKMNKQYRLKNSDEIGSIVQKRQRQYSDLYTIYYTYNNEDTRFAVVAGKKIGKAIIRNRIKREMREIIRPRLEECKNIHAVIVAKEKTNQASFQEKSDSLNKLISIMLERTKHDKKI